MKLSTILHLFIIFTIFKLQNCNPKTSKVSSFQSVNFNEIFSSLMKNAQKLRMNFWDLKTEFTNMSIIYFYYGHQEEFQDLFWRIFFVINGTKNILWYKAVKSICHSHVTHRRNVLIKFLKEKDKLKTATFTVK